jgi:prophage regulatory protein
MGERLIRAEEVMRRLGLRRSKFFEMVSAGELPPPVTVSGRVRAWVESEIDEYIASRIAASRSGTTHNTSGAS